MIVKTRSALAEILRELAIAGWEHKNFVSLLNCALYIVTAFVRSDVFGIIVIFLENIRNFAPFVAADLDVTVALIVFKENIIFWGVQAQLMAMCRSNAAEELAQRKGATVKEYSVLEELKDLLGLEKIPQYIESYDISNLAGTENVAGMIVYKNGKPYKCAYKKFKIKGFEGQDDYASMAEVIGRRFDEYYKAEKADEGFGKLPDLILLDGGKGQVAVVKKVLREMNIDVPLFGLVKDDKHRTRAVTGDGGEISVSSRRALFTFLSKMQDEVHRFAIGYHHSRRSKNTFKSSLTDIDGIGEKRARAMLKYFRTIDNISKADLEELEGCPQMTKNAAIAVYRYFHSNEKTTEN